MTGDRIVALIAMLLAMTLVVRALAVRKLPAGRITRLAMIWAGIFAAVTATILAVRSL